MKHLEKLSGQELVQAALRTNPHPVGSEEHGWFIEGVMERADDKHLLMDYLTDDDFEHC